MAANKQIKKKQHFKSTKYANLQQKKKAEDRNC